MYQLRPEIGDGARLTVVSRHVILYRVLDGVVRLERVLHGARDLPSIDLVP